jgi:hypothetical protein
MKYYQLLSPKHRHSAGLFQAENDEDSLKIVLLSVMYITSGIRDINHANTYLVWNNEVIKESMFHKIREKYNILPEASVFQWLIENQFVVLLSQEEFEQKIASKKRWKDTADFLQKNLKVCIREMARFHQENQAIAVQERYKGATKKELREIQTIKYWKEVCRHSHDMVLEWMYFDLPIETQEPMDS